MKITLIGAGNVATHLGKALVEAGHTIVQVYSRTMASAALLGEQVNASPITSLAVLSNEADVYILSVKDSVLTELLTEACKGRGEKVFLHTAGSMPLSVFEGKALHYGVLYPMQTFSKVSEQKFFTPQEKFFTSQEKNIMSQKNAKPVQYFPDATKSSSGSAEENGDVSGQITDSPISSPASAPCFLEFNDEVSERVVRTLAGSISDKLYDLDSEARRYLHLSAVWACNFVNHCYDIASELLAQHGIPFEVMLPLIDETARKVHELTPRQAQTGPAVRYDENVIGAQAKLLQADPLRRDIYELMSRSIHKMSQQ